MLKSNKEYTEEDITDQVVNGSVRLGKFEGGPFSFPGLRSDIEDIERHFFGGFNRLFEAAEDMKNSFFDVFGEFHSGNSSSSIKRGIPIEDHPHIEASSKPKESNSGDVDLSGLARDV